MDGFRSLWNRIEKLAVYGVLLLFFALQLVSLFIPSIASFMDSRGALLLIAVVLLFIFRYLDERIGTQDLDGLTATAGFTQGVVDLLMKNQELESLDILAYTSTMYFFAFRDSGARVNQVRLLLRSAEHLETVQLPTDSQAKQYFKQEVEKMVRSWFQLQQEGRIKTLSVKYYSFDSICHFMNVNGNLLHFGLFRPMHGFPGSGVLSSYVVQDYHSGGRQLIDDCKTEFELVWDEFGRTHEQDDDGELS